MAQLVLDALFGALTLDVEAFAIIEIAPNVRLTMPKTGAIEIHHVLQGTLHLAIGDGAPMIVPTGAMIAVPAGRVQHLAATLATATDKLSADVLAPIRDGMVFLDATDGQPAALRIACGTVLTDGSGSYGPLDSLSRPVIENLGDVPVVAAAFEVMLIEAAAPADGTRALTSALMKACLVFLLRRHVATSREAGIPPAITQDGRLGRAIARVLDRPAAAHSVGSLAAEAGMSRSAFARRFKEALEMTPMEFVTRTRLMHARRLLRATGEPIGKIASIVGFASRSHFTSTFRETYGVAPSAYRRNGGSA